MIPLPYISTFDGSGLTNSTSRQLSVLVSNWDFDLYSVAGIDRLVQAGGGGTFQLYDVDGRPLFSQPITSFRSVLLMPPRHYRRASEIRFDLNTINLGVNACGLFPIPTSQLAFRGVRWIDGEPARPAPYRTLPFSYQYRLNLDWFYYDPAPVVSSNVAAIRSFYIPVEWQNPGDLGFELQRIRVVRFDTGAVPTGVPFAMTLYDSVFRATSDAPVLLPYFNNRQTLATQYGSTFPVPALFYPIQTQIRLDIQSYVCNTDPDTPQVYQIHLEGCRRYSN